MDSLDGISQVKTSIHAVHKRMKKMEITNKTIIKLTIELTRAVDDLTKRVVMLEEKYAEKMAASGPVKMEQTRKISKAVHGPSVLKKPAMKHKRPKVRGNETNPVTFKIGSKMGAKSHDPENGGTKDFGLAR
jgi:hypothetical protein